MFHFRSTDSTLLIITVYTTQKQDGKPRSMVFFFQILRRNLFLLKNRGYIHPRDILKTVLEEIIIRATAHT